MDGNLYVNKTMDNKTYNTSNERGKKKKPLILQAVTRSLRHTCK